MTRGAEGSGRRPDDHAPVPHEWTCARCGDEWPCPPKRARLLEEYRTDRASLSVYLGSCLAVAAQDLRAAPMRFLQDRFIGWVPRRPRTF